MATVGFKWLIVVGRWLVVMPGR